jgi:Zn-dependent peptidase ImmA (M78 family)
MNNTNQERHRRNVREGRSLMAQLRAIVPQRPLRWLEAERLTELQANRFRELLGIDTPELPDEAITELPRLLVTSDGDLPVSASAHWSNGRWIITLNALEHPLRQRFSAAHELHHIICYPLAAWMFPGEPGLPSAVKAERLADYFAGALLMPKRHVKRLWGEGHRAARELAAYFVVSPRAMQFRLDQLGLSEPRRRCQPDARQGRHYNRYNRYNRAAPLSSLRVAA